MRHVQLDDQQIDLVKSIFSDLRTTQIVVSGLSAISPTHISNALNKRHPDRGMSKEGWQKFFDALHRIASNYLDLAATTQLSAEQLADYEIAEQIGPAALLAIDQRIDALRNDALWPTHSKETLVPPGELILTETKNFIALQQEAMLHENVMDCKHFIGLIYGPLKNGRSSLISRLHVSAENSGHRVFRVNYGNSYLAVDSKFTTEDLYRFIFEKLAFQFNPKQSDAGWQKSFINEAEKHWNESRATTVFIEGLEALAKDKASKKKVLLFLLWLNSLRDHATKSPFDQFQIVSVYTPYSEDGFRDSPFISQAKRTRLQPFTIEQCNLLCRAYNLSLDDSALNDIFENFLGQPYLTHCAIHSVFEKSSTSKLEIGELLQNEIKTANKLSGEYNEYWESVCQFLKFALDDVQAILDAAIGDLDNLNPTSHRLLQLSGVAFAGEDGKFLLSRFSSSAISVSEVGKHYG